MADLTDLNFNAETVAPEYNQERLDFDDVRSAWAGRELYVFEQAGIPEEVLDGRNHPCPNCQGTDRFNVDRIDHSKTWCNAGCELHGADPAKAWTVMRGTSYSDAMNSIADLLGVGGREPSLPLPPLKPIAMATPKTAKKHSPLNIKWADRDATIKALQPLADELGVPASALCDTGTVLYMSDDGILPTTFERDGQGNYIGGNVRLPDAKRRIYGKGAGLTYADDWDRGGTIYIVEGASDTAALYCLGLTVIGRPSNTGGVDYLADMLASVDGTREIIFIAERDEKPDGSWPGKDGAIRSARKLGNALRRKVGWSLPPGEYKDARNWFNSQGDDVFADGFERGLNVEYEFPAKRFPDCNPQEKYITHEFGQADLLRKRNAIIESGEPGLYVDRSPTGAGKTYACVFCISETQVPATVIVPTHKNCQEVIADFDRLGRVKAVAYPERIYSAGIDGNANCWNPEADEAERMGLPIHSTVCETCPTRGTCRSSGYWRGVADASDAHVKVMTHARAEHSGLLEVCQDAKYISIQECPLSMLAPRREIKLVDLYKMRQVFAAIDEGRGYRDLLTDRWISYADAIAACDDGIDPDYFDETEDDVLNSDEQSASGATIVNLSGGAFVSCMRSTVEKLIRRVQGANETVELGVGSIAFRNKRVLPVFFNVCRTEKLKFSKGSAPWKFLIDFANGEIRDSMISVHEDADGEIHKSVVGFRRNSVPDKSQVYGDATLAPGRIGAILGREEVEINPHGRYPYVKSVVQIARDVTRTIKRGKDAEKYQVVANEVKAALAEVPASCWKIGIIGHSNQIEGAVELLKSDPEFHPRTVEMCSYFWSGEEKASNEWHRRCDAVVIVGTPRVPPVVIQEHLFRVGETDAAMVIPEWRDDLAYDATTVRGRSVVVRDLPGYTDPAWRRAYQEIVVADLMQCVGRGRATRKHGCHVVVVSREQLPIPISDATLGDKPRASSTASIVLSAVRELSVDGKPVKTSKIAKAAGLTVQQCKRVLDQLCESGALVRHGNRGWTVT